MSESNRRREYNRLVAEGRLSQDDGSLLKEFGQPEVSQEPMLAKRSKK